MKKIGSIGLVFVFLLLASNAFADIFSGSVQLTDNPATWVTYPIPGGPTVPVSPYSASVVYGTQSFSGYVTCLDYSHGALEGTPVNGTWYTPSSWSSVPTSTPGFSAGQVTLYTEVSWLVDHLGGLTQTAPNAANPAYVGPISVAIWNIMVPGSTLVDATAQQWINDAIYAASHGYVADNSVFIPTNWSATETSTSQRFMLNPSSAVPLPPAILLLAPGLLGLGMLRKRYKS